MSGWSGSDCDVIVVELNKMVISGAVGIAIGLVIGISVAAFVCVYRYSKRREYNPIG